jgi:hypothetical protein
LTVSARGVRKTTRTKSVQSRKAKAKTYNKSRKSRDTQPRQKPGIPYRKTETRRPVDDWDSDRARFFTIRL